MALWRRIAELEASGTPAALATVVEVSGSTPRGPGARMLVFVDGTAEGTVGGGRLEAEVIEAAKVLLTSGEATELLELKLTQELGMCCGGQVRVFLERLGPANELLVFGAGHVGQALALMAAAAGFRVTVVDERDELLSAERFPTARRVSDLEDPALPFSPRTFVMVTTHDHALDQKLVERALRRERRWLGLIGSRRKAAMTRERLRARGFDERDVSAVRCPVGLAIGAETPAEIAVSILAEIVAIARGRSLGEDILSPKGST